MRKVFNARSEYVAGPMRPGDQHPWHPGWQYTGQRGADGELLWYQPPGAFRRWVRRIALSAFLAMLAVGVFAAFFVESAA